MAGAGLAGSAEFTDWLELLKLTSYSEPAKGWCRTMGAVSFSDVFECWEQLSDELKLKPLERKRIAKYIQKRAEAGDPAVSSAAASSAAAVAGGKAAPAAAPVAPSPPPAAPPAPPRRPGLGYVGQEPNRYKLLEELGSGATATVFRCMKGEQQFAVKQIDLTRYQLQPDFQRVKDVLLREVTILFKLRHPRIVCLYDLIEQDLKLHVVMELVDGGDLFSYIVHKGCFSEMVAQHVFLQITEGLQYIHSKDVVYRDLKPENILVDEKASKGGFYEIKLSDFGHSKLINDGYSTALTSVGTPQFWAPEVADPRTAAKGYDQSVDLWSLGVVLYVMLYGTYPFDGVDESIEVQIKKAHLPFVSQIPGREVSRTANDLIRALIKVRSKERLPLAKCLTHPWVVAAGGSRGRPTVPQETAEERLQLPVKPTKKQVEQLRRDLNIWMTKFKCFATVKYGEVIANVGDIAEADQVEAARSELRGLVECTLGAAPIAQAPLANPSHPESPLPSVQEEPSPEQAPRGRPRLIAHSLVVHPQDGAGLQLIPEQGGMRITHLYDCPGQPGLQSHDLIVSINEVSLRGKPERVEKIFAAHFDNGAQLAIRRD